jgi:class 3 adenylate cyclase
LTYIRETSPTPSLEMAHVLFMDIVAYSTLPMDHQHQVLHELQEIVRETSEFARAQSEDRLLRLPTGDGMALVFFHDPEAPVRCALELSRILRDHSSIKLRMGIHTGPVYRVADINANHNVAGGGINIAQRVMDCGDAGHILVSDVQAEVLGQVSAWRPMLHDLGEVEVKHGDRVHLYSLYTDEAGNAELPQKLSAAQKNSIAMRPKAKIKNLALRAGAAAAIATLAIVGFSYSLRARHHAKSPRIGAEVDTHAPLQPQAAPSSQLVTEEKAQQTKKEIQKAPENKEVSSQPKNEKPPAVLVTGGARWISTDDTISTSGQAIKMDEHGKVESNRLSIIDPTQIDTSGFADRMEQFINEGEHLTDSEIPAWSEKVSAYLESNLGLVFARNFSSGHDLETKIRFLKQWQYRKGRPLR